MVLLEALSWMKSWLSGTHFTEEHCRFSLLFHTTGMTVFGMTMGSFRDKVRLSIQALSLIETSYSAGGMTIDKFSGIFHQLQKQVPPEVEMSHVRQIMDFLEK